MKRANPRRGLFQYGGKEWGGRGRTQGRKSPEKEEPAKRHQKERFRGKGSATKKRKAPGKKKHPKRRARIKGTILGKGERVPEEKPSEGRATTRRRREALHAETTCQLGGEAGADGRDPGPGPSGKTGKFLLTIQRPLGIITMLFPKARWYSSVGRAADL